MLIIFTAIGILKGMFLQDTFVLRNLLTSLLKYRTN
jgi:hypothetical protein